MLFAGAFHQSSTVLESICCCSLAYYGLTHHWNQVCHISGVDSDVWTVSHGGEVHK
jgi:hypothetical protein